MRATHSINKIYKLISFWIYICCFLQKLLNDQIFMIVIHSNILCVMHGFRDNDVLLPTEYDVIVIRPLGGASGNFSRRILKERPWLPDSVP